MDPFKILEIEPRFDIDVEVVARRHLEMSRALHPDRFVGRSSSERRLALSRAIEVNEAWRVFKDPVRRAEALLMRLGIDASETSGAKADPELLMEMMEHREDLAQARMTKDVSRLSSLITMMKEREEKVIASLTQAFEKEPPSASAHLAELRFVRRFLEEASVAEDELL